MAAQPGEQPDAAGLAWLVTLNWLLLFLPAAAVLDWAGLGDLWVFVASSLAIVPLAGLLGRATESLAEALGPAAGGLLNATFGNATELIIGLAALNQGPRLYPLVKASLTGSIIGNVLLVLGLSILLGGLRYRHQIFNRTAASMGTTLLALASVGLLVPAVYSFAVRLDVRPGARAAGDVALLSQQIAAVLIVVYVLSLLFTLRTHRDLYAAPEKDLLVPTGRTRPEWSSRFAMLVLVASTAGVAWMSELLVRSVETAAHALGLGPLFIGVIVVAVVGNAAEHSTAVLMALKNKIDLAFHIAVGSGIQMALFVAPVLVFASLLFGHAQPLDLHFTLLETAAVVLSVGVLALVSHDGETHWLEGVLLLAVYVVLALAFFHLSEAAE
jgi:Ca2+:H+ antiporter